MKHTLLGMTAMIEKKRDELNAIAPVSNQKALDTLDFFFNLSDFLRRSLNIGQFIPAVLEGGVWRVLEKPDGYDLWIGGVVSDYPEYLEYQKALENVLFDGFTVSSSGNHDTENPYYAVSNGENEVTFHIGRFNFSKGVKFAITIEDLTPIHPELSSNAVNILKL